MTALSKSQIDELGDRLRVDESEDDVRLFNVLLDSRRAALDKIEEAILNIDAGIALGRRLKSLRSTVEKLRRSATMHLSQMQDLGGIRVMLSSRDEEDQFASRLLAVFPESRVKDRRIQPQHGYRAVHVIVRLENVPIEIQLRTLWQHFWAERFERIADLIGRDIRYGLPPRRKSDVASRALEIMQRLSAAIDVFERTVSENPDPRDIAAAALRDKVIDELIEVWRELFRSGV